MRKSHLAIYKQTLTLEPFCIGIMGGGSSFRNMLRTCEGSEDIVSNKTNFFKKRFGDFLMILSITIENLK